MQLYEVIQRDLRYALLSSPIGNMLQNYITILYYNISTRVPHVALL